MKRVFFGLDLDAQTLLQIANWRDRQLACDGHPVPPANFHITLAFIGELSDTAIDRLCHSLDEWLAHTRVEGSTLNLDCTGYWQKPGIFWLGASRRPDQLNQLAKKLSNLSSAVGGKRDKRPFQPHVTLYRRCHAAPVAPLEVPAITLNYQHCTLFESRQGRQGVSYHALQDWSLLPSAD
jgi:2'-5' RNA ligase